MVFLLQAGVPVHQFSFSKYNTKEEIDFVIGKVKHIVEQNIAV
jgi:cysteine desulfurase